MEGFLSALKKLIPRKVFLFLQPAYHYTLALLGALLYGFPSKKLMLVGVTGSKGKTSTTEMINAILESAGYKTALANTLRFKIGNDSKANLFKMTMPGRFFLQRFLREALRANCTHAVMEMSSEGVVQYRHRFLYPDALVFTNIEPEHIESHGSYQKYLLAKKEIGWRVVRNGKKISLFVGNADDKEIEIFSTLPFQEQQLYRLSDATTPTKTERGSDFSWRDIVIRLQLPGIFNICNALSAATLAEALGIEKTFIKKGLESVELIPGRAERVEAGQPFEVIVDYAHTPRSLESIYQAYADKEKICVLSGTGGGRDTWKRPLMGEIANAHCAHIILTDEDPYDEDPARIVSDIKKGITLSGLEIEMDRRAAIGKALARGKPGSAVLITGKGTDPYIMGPSGSKIPWSDKQVALEELAKLGFKKS